MNTKSFQDQKDKITVGTFLKNVRESIGLSQELVAQKLCLKVSFIQDLEEDIENKNISSVFFRGYVRSYARLLNISEEEVMSKIENTENIKEIKEKQIKDFNLKKSIKRTQMFFTRSISIISIIIVISLSFLILKNFRDRKNKNFVLKNDHHVSYYKKFNSFFNKKLNINW